MFGKKDPGEKILSEIVSQAFSAQNERIKIQNEKIAELSAENKMLKEKNEAFWEVLQKMDSKLSIVYGEVFGGGGDSTSLQEWKYGEGDGK